MEENILINYAYLLNMSLQFYEFTVLCLENEV